MGQKKSQSTKKILKTIPPGKTNRPRILFVDIETAPNTAHVWGLFKQTVSINQLMESSYTLCWAAKWHDEDEVMFSSVHESKPNYMLGALYSLLEEADVVVHYNGSKFDIPTINKEFLLLGWGPPRPYHQVDLLRVTRNKFKFPSNRLDYVAQQLGLGKKHEHEGHSLWVKCMAGDKESWKTMEEYNIQDVILLEELYEELLPWINTHPNHALYKDEDRPVCTNCGGDKVTKQGKARTKSRVYQQWKCGDCGTWMRSRLSDKEATVPVVTQQQL